MTAGNLERLKGLIGQMQNANCPVTEFQAYVDAAQTQTRVDGLLGQAEGAAGQCDFVKALEFARQAAQLNPRSSLAVQSVARFQPLAAAQASVTQLAAQARAAMRNPDEARRLIAQAETAANGVSCLLALIPSPPAGGGQTGGGQPEPPKDPGPGKPPAKDAGKCGSMWPRSRPKVTPGRPSASSRR